MAFLTVNIDTRGVVAELKGIRAAQESTAKVMAEILEAIKSEPGPSPDDSETQRQVDELAGLTNQSSDTLDESMSSRENPKP